MAMTDLSTVVLSKTASFSGGTLSWMSPELLDPLRFGSDGRPTCQSDCYALGMVIYEVGWKFRLLIYPFAYRFQVLTGLRPFHHIIACTPVPAVMRGDRPRKPLDAGSLGLSDALWELVRLCWSESSSARPTARQLLDFFSSASLTWDPPPVYPVVVVHPSNSESEETSLVISRGAGAVGSVGGLLVVIVVLLLLLFT